MKCEATVSVRGHHDDGDGHANWMVVHCQAEGEHATHSWTSSNDNIICGMMEIHDVDVPCVQITWQSKKLQKFTAGKLALGNVPPRDPLLDWRVSVEVVDTPLTNEFRSTLDEEQKPEFDQTMADAELADVREYAETYLLPSTREYLRFRKREDHVEAQRYPKIGGDDEFR